MRPFALLICLIALLIFACQPVVDDGEDTDDRPNVVLILVDDLGFSDIAAYGSEVATPNLDRLAERGMTFTQFHNTSKCFPTRASLLTGLYAHQSGNGRTYGALQGAMTLGELLQQGGYYTLASGKHHGTENLFFRGFDHYYGLREGAANHFNPGEPREGEPVPAQKQRGEFRPFCLDSLTLQPYNPPADFYTTDYFTRYALDFLRQAPDPDQPFFLYLAYTAPHDPLMAWPEDIARYEGRYDEGYEAIRQARYARQLASGLLDSALYPLSEATFTPWETLSPEEQAEEAQKMAVYAAMIDRLDQNIGQLLAYLDSSGQAGNTLIFFVSDNGASAEMVGARGLNPEATTGEIGSVGRWSSLGPDWANVCNVPFRYYKNFSYEGGTCTPMIAYWPGKIQPGSRTSFMGHVIDFAPTLAELAGVTYPDSFRNEALPPLPGVSLLPVLQGDTSSRQEPLFYEWQHGRAVWEDGWKAIEQGDSGWELYRLATDRTEQQNLAEQHPERLRRMRSRWEMWRKAVGD